MFIADFHIHSKYSRAVSPKMNLEGLDEGAKVKGIDLISCGDFTHPEWFLEIRKKLKETSNGLFFLKHTHFILTGEVSLIYNKLGKNRKIHLILIVPNFEVAEKVNKKLGEIANLKSDGRPILGIDAKEFLKIILDIDKNILVVPAHIMTPWFGLYGSKSGFDSIEECFEELSEFIYAYETGLSADPKMLLGMKECRERTLLSNSDAHSLEKIGREATVFNGELNYTSLIKKIKKNDLAYTIEFYPQEGKYFNDGHRNCEVNVSPKESYQYGEICPVCGKPLTIGVLNRILKLSDGGGNENIKFKSLVPLKEIISEVLNLGVNTKGVNIKYENFIREFNSEFNILLNEKISNLEKLDSQIALGIEKVRKGELSIVPGFDGKFGKVKIFSKEEIIKVRQKTLF